MTGKIWLNYIFIFSVYNQNIVLEGASGVTVSYSPYTPVICRWGTWGWERCRGRAEENFSLECKSLFKVSNPAKSRCLELDPLWAHLNTCVVKPSLILLRMLVIRLYINNPPRVINQNYILCKHFLIVKCSYSL